MISKNNCIFNIALILFSIVIIIYLLYLNDKKIFLIENFTEPNGYDYLIETQVEGNLQNCLDNLYYIQCIISEKDPLNPESINESARYNLYYDIEQKILRFGKITKNEEGFFIYNDQDNDDQDDKYYLLNDIKLSSRKDFRFKINLDENKYFLRSYGGISNMEVISLGNTFKLDKIRLLRHKKEGTEIDNYKIIFDDNNPLIVSFFDENQNINLNYDNDLLCEFYNYDYKNKLSNILNSNYKNNQELENEFYDKEKVNEYLEDKKSIEKNSNNQYCPLSHPYPFDTISDSVVIDDENNMDFTINFNNKCCSEFPILKLKEKDLKDRVSNEILDEVELGKIGKYIGDNNINLLNHCDGEIISESEDKKYSILNIKDDEKAKLNGSYPIEIKNIDTIITDKSLYSQQYIPPSPSISENNLKNDLPFQIHNRTLFELKCVKGTSRVEIQSSTSKVGAAFTSSDGRGSEGGD